MAIPSEANAPHTIAPGELTFASVQSIIRPIIRLPPAGNDELAATIRPQPIRPASERSAAWIQVPHGARENHIDLRAAEWRIPAERMEM